MAIKRLLFVTLLVTALFLLFPQIDLIVSGFFYRKPEGFIGEQSLICALLYESVRVYTILLVIFVIISLIVSFINKFSHRVPTRKALLYMFLVCMLGAGVTVHHVIKEFLPRERPRHVEQFGGDKKFTKVFHRSESDGKSFISGHTAMAFTTVALAYMGRRRRRFLLPIAYSYGTAVALTRIAQGGHFLSDVVYAALLSLWLIYGLRFIVGYSAAPRPQSL